MSDDKPDNNVSDRSTGTSQGSTTRTDYRVSMRHMVIVFLCTMRRVLRGRYGPTVVQLVPIGILTIIGLRFAWADAIDNQPHVEVSIVRAEVPRTGLPDHFRRSVETMKEDGFPGSLLNRIKFVTEDLKYDTRADLIKTLRVLADVQLELEQEQPTGATQEFMRSVSELRAVALNRYFTQRRVAVITNIENHSRVPTTILRNAVLLIANSKDSWETIDVSLDDDIVLGGGHASQVFFVSEILGNMDRDKFLFVDSEFDNTSLCALVITDIRDQEWWTVIGKCADGELSDNGLAQRLYEKHRPELE